MSSPFTIAIDASRSVSTIQKTGVEKVSDELLKNFVETRQRSLSSGQTSLVSTDTDINFIFYTPHQISWLPQESQKILHWPFKFFWTQIRLAWELIFHPPNAVFFPVHAMPLFLIFFLPFTNYRLPASPAGRPVTSYYHIIHDIAFKKHPELYSWQQKIILNLDLWLSLKLCTKIFVPTEAVKNDILSFCHSYASFCHSRLPRRESGGLSGNPVNSLTNKIIVTHWGYNKMNNESRVLGMNYGERKKQFLYIGRVEEKKNISNLIKAFEIFHATNPEYKLILAGQITDYKLQITDYKNIEFLGYISDEKKYELLQESTALIFVSKEEGFGFPILEAFDFGLPVIAGDIPVLREIGGDACLYVNPDSVDDIAQGLMNIVETRLIASLQEKGYSRLQNFSWQITTEKILNEIIK